MEPARVFSVRVNFGHEALPVGRQIGRPAAALAAIDQAEYPYNLEPVRQAQHLAAADQQYAQRLEQLATDGALELTGSPQGRHLADAMELVIDSNYCVKCHVIGDFDPPGIDS